MRAKLVGILFAVLIVVAFSWGVHTILQKANDSVVNAGKALQYQN